VGKFIKGERNHRIAFREVEIYHEAEMYHEAETYHETEMYHEAEINHEADHVNPSLLPDSVTVIFPRVPRC
jgi:hypothetical protein